MRAIVDRFEGNVAVLEVDGGKSFADVPRAELPKGTRAGDALVRRGDAWEPDEAATKSNHATNDALVDELFRD